MDENKVMTKEELKTFFEQVGNTARNVRTKEEIEEWIGENLTYDVKIDGTDIHFVIMCERVDVQTIMGELGELCYQFLFDGIPVFTIPVKIVKDFSPDSTFFEIVVAAGILHEKLGEKDVGYQNVEEIATTYATELEEDDQLTNKK